MIKKIIVLIKHDHTVGFRASLMADRPVVKVIESPNWEVGLNSNGFPVYIRVENAALIDPRFAAMSAKILQNPDAPAENILSHSEWDTVKSVCFEKGFEMLMNYSRRHIQDEAVHIERQRELCAS